MLRKSILYIILFLLTISVLLIGMNPVLGEVEQDKKQEIPDTVSMDIRNADIRDVLSAIAVDMDCNIIYTGEPIKIDFRIKDVTRTSALEFLLKSVGMDYIRSGGTIIIGTRETLTGDFFNNLVLTQFSLKYISSDVLAAQIDALGIPVQKTTLDANTSSIWIQGIPQDLGKVRELIYMLDKEENVNPPSEESSYKLSPVALTYITAGQMNDILTEVGMQPGLILEGNPKTLYVYATAQEYEKINELRGKIDTPENRQGSGSIMLLKKLKYIKAGEIVPIIEQFGLDIDVITFSRTVQTVWLKGEEQIIDEVSSLIDKIDIIENLDDNVFFVHKLDNITAADAVTRLSILEIPEIKTFTFNYPQFSKRILVFCPQDYKTVVVNHLIRLDVLTDKIKVPIDYSDSNSGVYRLTQRRDLLVMLTGIPAESFTISQNISRQDETPHYVLILEETPEKIKIAEDMIAKIDAPLDNEFEPEYTP